MVLEGKKKEIEKGDVDVKHADKTNQSTVQATSENDDDEIKSLDNVASKAQVVMRNQLYFCFNILVPFLLLSRNEMHEKVVNRTSLSIKVATLFNCQFKSPNLNF